MVSNRCVGVIWSAAAALLLVPALAAAQELSLSQALRRADAGAYANRVAAGQAGAQEGEGMRALQGILPSLRLEAGYVRTTDPIGAFGITLRQRAITPANFDPARLNRPGATPNYTGALVLEQPLFNLDAHLGRRTAAHANAASRASEAWTRTETGVDMVRAYYGGVLAAERVATLEAASEAAHAHVRQAERMTEQGLVTRSDALLARVQAGEIDTQLAEARGESALVKRQVALLLGEPGDTSLALPERLPSVGALGVLRGMDWRGAVEQRGDVRAAEEGWAATRTDVRRARSLYLPRLNAMGRYDWNSIDSPFAGDENWSVGIVASWSPFAGASQLAEGRAAAGREAAARARADAARARGGMETAEAESAWQVALERLRIADEAVLQSGEAHRIVARKYEGGLATVAELLSAAATEMESQTRLSHARYQLLVTTAERLQVLGRDVAELADLLEQS